MRHVDDGERDDELEEEEIQEERVIDEGPGGGAFSSWSDFWRYKEG